MLEEVRDLPKVTQPGLVTAEDTLVSPGMSPPEPRAERDQLANSCILENWQSWELLRRGGHSLMILATRLPSAPVSQKTPFSPSHT